MMTFEKRTLVRESEWMRVFKLQDQNTYLYESKFLVDNLHVSAAAIEKRWQDLSADQRIEFASAFSCQPPRDDDDRRILEFLMGMGPEEVWAAIAKLMPFYPDRTRALRFLSKRAEDAVECRANYYQAIESIRGEPTVSLLRGHWYQYQSALMGEAREPSRPDLWIDYLQCSKTLWTLTRDAVFLSALKEAQTTAPVAFRPLAAKLLREAEHDAR